MYMYSTCSMYILYTYCVHVYMHANTADHILIHEMTASDMFPLGLYHTVRPHQEVSLVGEREGGREGG